MERALFVHNLSDLSGVPAIVVGDGSAQAKGNILSSTVGGNEVEPIILVEISRNRPIAICGYALWCV